MIFVEYLCVKVLLCYVTMIILHYFDAKKYTHFCIVVRISDVRFYSLYSFLLLKFIKNLRGTNGGGDHDPEMLADIYQAIREDEIIMPAEQKGLGGG